MVHIFFTIGVRSSIKMDIDGKQGAYILFVDYHMKVTVDLTANL